MKKRLLRVVFALLLIATLPIQTDNYLTTTIYAAKTADTSVEDATNPTEKATKSKNNENTVKEASDTTDGNTDVSWPQGPAPKSLTSSSAVLMDVDTGLILYNKNMTDKHYPASITKIMTTLLTVENCKLDDVVTFTKDEVTNLEYGASNIATQVGEKLTIEQCLYGIMLSSANEVCNGVADYISGDSKSFGELMTSRAKALGCVNTNFTNANGLHSDDHYTCAYDMALIGQEAFQNEIFRKVANTKSYYMDKTNKSNPRTLTNHHNMINAYTTSQFLYDNCVGGKTGFTSVAGSTLVTFAQRDGMTLVCVVMQGGSAKVNLNKNIYTDTISLLEFGFNNYQAHDLSETKEDTNEESPLFTTFASIYDTEVSPLKNKSSGVVLIPNGISLSDAKQEVNFYEDSSTAAEEHEVGTITYTYGQKNVGSTTVYFDPTALSDTLTEAEDIVYTRNTYIAGQTKLKSANLRRIAIVVCLVIVVVVGILYIRTIIGRKKTSKRRYRK